MSVYRKKGSTIYTMNFRFQGQSITESTRVRTKELARRVERNRRTALEEGSAGVARPKPAQLFAVVAEEFMDTRAASIPEGEKRGKASTLRIDRFNLNHLLPYFGKTLLCDITPNDVAKYQKARLAQGAASKTVNLEMGTFRAITSESEHWSRLAKKVGMLPNGEEVGRCLPPHEIDAILEACQMSESRLLYPIVLLQLETGSRSGTVLQLPWNEVDFVGRGLRWGRDKTKAGTKRTVPISTRAMLVLEAWKDQFPQRKPQHFVFPSERYRQPKDRERGKVSAFVTDPTRHVTSVQHSWETAQERAAWILAGRPESLKETSESFRPFHCRFHDLRHTACTRMMEAGTPIPVIAQLVGWSPTTMWAMAAKYGHFSQDVLREAVETISTGRGSLPKSLPKTLQAFHHVM